MKCETCGQEFSASKDIDSTRFCCEHCRRVYLGKCTARKRRENETLESSMAKVRLNIKHNNKPLAINSQPGGNCQFCGKECHNRNSLINHERCCSKNPDRALPNFHRYTVNHGAWNKGLTKETDKRVAHHSGILLDGYSTGRIVNPWPGKKHTEEEKKKISETMKRKIASGEIEAPYKLNHYSKGPSYPEQYFIDVFKNAGISIEYNFQVGLYQLDFANPTSKKYVEIDGEQHYVDPRIVKHDEERTMNLQNQGWILICRVRWSEFQKLTDNERQEICLRIVNELE